jgi:hypothetical protein
VASLFLEFCSSAIGKANIIKLSMIKEMNVPVFILEIKYLV